MSHTHFKLYHGNWMTNLLEIHWDYSMFFKLWKCARLSQQVQLTQKEARYEFNLAQIWNTSQGSLHLNFILNCTWMSVNITWQKNFHEPPVQRFNNYNLWIIKASGQHCLNAWTYAHTTHTHTLTCSALWQHTLYITRLLQLSMHCISWAPWCMPCILPSSDGEGPGKSEGIIFYCTIGAEWGERGYLGIQKYW